MFLSYVYCLQIPCFWLYEQRLLFYVNTQVIELPHRHCTKSYLPSNFLLDYMYTSAITVFFTGLCKYCLVRCIKLKRIQDIWYWVNMSQLQAQWTSLIRNACLFINLLQYPPQSLVYFPCKRRLSLIGYII